jgi:hypothetical protein
VEATGSREEEVHHIKDHDPQQVEQLIERYLRHEMSPDEEQAWEEHYLSCDHCFRLLRQTETVALFVRAEAAAKERTAEAPAREAGWRTLLGSVLQPFLHPAGLRPSLVAALALLVVGVPAIVGWLRVGTLQRRLDDLRQPAIPLASYSLRGPYRGPEGTDLATGPEIQLRKGGGAFLLRIPALAGVKPSSTYRAYVVDPQGRTVWTSGDLEVEGAARGFRIYCQATFFRPGHHDLRLEEIHPTSGEVLQTFTFPFEIVAASE